MARKYTIFHTLALFSGLDIPDYRILVHAHLIYTSIILWVPSLRRCIDALYTKYGMRWLEILFGQLNVLFFLTQNFQYSGK